MLGRDCPSAGPHAAVEQSRPREARLRADVFGREVWTARTACRLGRQQARPSLQRLYLRTENGPSTSSRPGPITAHESVCCPDDRRCLRVLSRQLHELSKVAPQGVAVKLEEEVVQRK